MALKTAYKMYYDQTLRSKSFCLMCGENASRPNNKTVLIRRTRTITAAAAVVVVSVCEYHVMTKLYCNQLINRSLSILPIIVIVVISGTIAFYNGALITCLCAVERSGKSHWENSYLSLDWHCAKWYENRKSIYQFNAFYSISNCFCAID